MSDYKIESVSPHEDMDRSSNRLELSYEKNNRLGLNSNDLSHETNTPLDENSPSPALKPKTKNFAKPSPPKREKEVGTFVSKNPKSFGICREDLVILFDKYGRNVSFDEEILEINSMGDTSGLLKKLRTDSEKGLSMGDQQDIRNRKEDFGENKFFEEPMPHCCVYVWEGLDDTMIRLLILAAIFQIIVGNIPLFQETEYDWIEGMGIIFAVVVVVSVGSLVNFTKEKKFRELNDQNNELVKITVRRDNSVQEIQEEDILVGEIVKLSYGMIIPADGYLVEGNEIKCDESPLTGESDLIEKESIEECERRIDEEIMMNKGVKPKGKHVVASPLVFSGTLVTEGQGWFCALRIGPDSEKGKIRAQVEAEQQKGKDKKASEDKKEDDKKEGEGEEKKEEEEEGGGEVDEAKTPLELKLEELAEDISNFGLVSAVCTLVALLVRLIYFEVQSAQTMKTVDQFERSNWFNSTLLGESPKKRPSTDIKHILVEVIRILILCVAVMVVAIPEGLPLAVTLTLAFSIGKMMDDNNLVRKMNACETMGGANYICSDKTGTLTKNEMSVNVFFNCQEVLNFDELTADKANRESSTKYFNDKYYDYLKLSITLNIEAELDERDEIVKASKTDVAFVDLLHNFREELTKIRAIYMPKKELREELKRFPFTSSRKKMSTIIHNNKFETGSIIFQKGASEIVLRSCEYYLDSKNGTQASITDDKKIGFEKIIKQFADKALRTICVAFKNIPIEEVDKWKEKDEDNNNVIESGGFCLIGIFGIKDKLRDGVPEAVDICKGAGIKVVMVTGDNIDTAVAIAKECNIITEEIERESSTACPTSITGKEFYEKIGGMVCDSCEQDLKFCSCPRTQGAVDALKEIKRKDNPNWKGDIPLRKERIVKKDVFKKIHKNLKVIARSRPEDKYTMVYGLRELGEVVAVTGDGTNDAPALSKSNVGFAMGISGTDIAKQAADIIILNDNFATIVLAVKWGRNIYDNIRKFVQFQLTVNVCACILVFISSCIGNETALGAIQMLWLNLIMDSLGSLALATEPPHDNLLNRKPYPKKEYIINTRMWKHIVFQALFQLGFLVAVYLVGHEFIPESNPRYITVAEQLKACYGTIPGQKKGKSQDTSKMIAGPALFWEKEILRQPDATPKQCGDFFKYRNLEEAKPFFLGTYGSTHLTLIFNSFVLYTLFNQINVRVIDGSYNIFQDFHKNWMFATLIFVELGLQALIVQFTGKFFKVADNGLDGIQWSASFIFGMMTFFVSILLKPIPLEKCFEMCKKKEEEDDDEDPFPDDMIDAKIQMQDFGVSKGHQIEIGPDPTVSNLLSLSHLNP